MNISYRILRNREPSFNRRSHFELEFRAICRNYGCDYISKRQNRLGYYLTDASGDAIFIDSRVSGHQRREVQFHEITHLLLDFPCDFLDFRQQLRAEIFAIVFMIPKKLLFEYMQISFDEIDYRLIPYLKKRLWVYETFGF